MLGATGWDGVLRLVGAAAKGINTAPYPKKLMYLSEGTFLINSSKLYLQLNRVGRVHDGGGENGSGGLHCDQRLN